MFWNVNFRLFIIIEEEEDWKSILLIQLFPTNIDTYGSNWIIINNIINVDDAPNRNETKPNHHNLVVYVVYYFALSLSSRRCSSSKVNTFNADKWNEIQTDVENYGLLSIYLHRFTHWRLKMLTTRTLSTFIQQHIDEIIESTTPKENSIQFRQTVCECNR